MGKNSEHGQSRYYPDIYLNELRKTTNMLSQDSWYPWLRCCSWKC